MNKLHFLIFLLISSCLWGQNYQRVQISEQHIPKLLALGITMDHPISQFKGDGLILDINNFEVQLLKTSAIPFQVLSSDVEALYQNQLEQNSAHLRNPSCGTSIHFQTPQHFKLGSMGGYLTYDEFLKEIDSMQLLYPDLISAKAAISNFTTYEGRPIYHLKMSDQVSVNENEKEILFTALHHAREAASLSQMIYFMWHLLEQYGVDPEITYLLDNSAIYFVPMLNPDGYIYNETQQPNGGGMWRKNRRNNGDGSYGVDLNRNYGYQYGGLGTSSSGSSDVYKGTGAFSEPETQAIKWLCEQHQFEYALNYHSHGNLLLFPFGFDNNQFTPDHNYYLKIADFMTWQNGYTDQISSALYPAAGDSDDWMYGEQASKDKIFAFTPEIGADAHGFWPASNEIIPICQESLELNLKALRCLHPFAELQHETDLNVTADFYHHFDLKHFSFENGNYTVGFNALSANIANAPVDKIFNGTDYTTIIKDSFLIQLDGGIVNGDLIRYEITLNNGTHIWRDTIEKSFGTLPPFYSDQEDLNRWTSTGGVNWSLTNEMFSSPSYSYAHAPNSNYSNNTSGYFTFNDTLDLSLATQANIQFNAFWRIEDDYDYVSFEVKRLNSGTWEPQCGVWTNSGTSDQIQGAPLFDGNSGQWLAESIDLSSYFGDVIQFRFHFYADAFVNDIGFYFDDFQIVGRDLSWYTGTNSGLDEYEIHWSLYPIPAQNHLILQSDPSVFIEKYQIFDLHGRTILEAKYEHNIIDIQVLTHGTYLFKMTDTQGSSYFKKFVKG